MIPQSLKWVLTALWKAFINLQGSPPAIYFRQHLALLTVAAVSNLALAAGDWQSVSSRGQIRDSCHTYKLQKSFKTCSRGPRRYSLFPRCTVSPLEYSHGPMWQSVPELSPFLRPQCHECGLCLRLSSPSEKRGKNRRRHSMPRESDLKSFQEPRDGGSLITLCCLVKQHRGGDTAVHIYDAIPPKTELSSKA